MTTERREFERQPWPYMTGHEFAAWKARNCQPDPKRPVPDSVLKFWLAQNIISAATFHEMTNERYIGSSEDFERLAVIERRWCKTHESAAHSDTSCEWSAIVGITDKLTSLPPTREPCRVARVLVVELAPEAVVREHGNITSIISSGLPQSPDPLEKAPP